MSHSHNIKLADQIRETTRCFIFAIVWPSGDDKEVRLFSNSEREARDLVWASLSEYEKNAVESIDLLDIIEIPQ